MAKSCVPSRGEWAIPIYWEHDEKGPGVVAWAFNLPQQAYYRKRLGSNQKWVRDLAGPKRAFYSNCQEWTKYAPGCPPVPRVHVWKYPRPSCDIQTNRPEEDVTEEELQLDYMRTKGILQEMWKEAYPTSLVTPKHVANPNTPLNLKDPATKRGVGAFLSDIKDRGLSVEVPTEQIQAALAPVARDMEALRYDLDQAKGYIEWLEGEVDDLASGARFQDQSLDEESAVTLARISYEADKRSWSMVFRSFVMTSIMVGVIVGGCFGLALGGASGGACAMSLMAVLQLMQAMSYREEARQADQTLEKHGCVRIGRSVFQAQV